jgi:hypothetical protein
MLFLGCAVPQDGDSSHFSPAYFTPFFGTESKTLDIEKSVKIFLSKRFFGNI